MPPWGGAGGLGRKEKRYVVGLVVGNGGDDELIQP